MIDYLYESAVLTLCIIICYKFAMFIQHKANKIWLNPMLISMAIIISGMALLNYSIEAFKQHSAFLNWLLEPAIVALGYPLYQHIQAIKKSIVLIISILTGAIATLLAISYTAGKLILADDAITISLTLKSITVPIGITLTEKLNGIPSLTALTITIAGLTGAIIGHAWLNSLKITSPQAQGLAVGCASHALGTTAISRISMEHSAFSSLALALSALITAIVAQPVISFIEIFF